MKKWFLTAGLLVILLSGIFITKKILFPPYEPPPPSGSHPIQQTTVTWTDHSRTEAFRNDKSSRWLNVDFYYPEDAENKNAAYPLILFSHGAYGISLSNYSTYAELASHGYIIASISHTYHAAYSKSTDGKTALVSGEFMKQINRNQSKPMDIQEYEDSRDWIQVRKEDINFVLDTILEKQMKDETFYASADKERIGIMGHSLGGACAVLIGREREDIDAVINIDGTALGEIIGFADGEPVYRKDPYPIALLDIYGENHWESAFDYEKLYGSYINFILDKNALNGHFTVVSGAGHMNFTDLPFFSPILASKLGVGTRDAKECGLLVNDLILSFYNTYLKEEGTFYMN